VHRSNFFMEGFVGAPSTRELAALAKKKRLPFASDLGSGAIVDVGKLFGGDAQRDELVWPHEPTAEEELRSGADVVTFSGDKLFGGPQAGIIAGKARLVTSLKRDPFFRALRASKLILAALEKTTDLHLRGAYETIPVVQMVTAKIDALEARARALMALLAGSAATLSVGRGQAQVGGGTLPQVTIPSVTLDIVPHAMKPHELARRLRAARVPVLGYLDKDRFRLDLRTIFPAQEPEVVAALQAAFEAP
jgi:L-seryl-tRNA(Ser) seleniumtransferase